LDYFATICIIPLALWILVSGLDDLFVTAVWALSRKPQGPWPTAAELAAAPKRKIAILVPLWREHDVIARMLEHNTSVIRYENYEIFCGVYANDQRTRIAVEAVAARNPRVHLAVCPRPGPTSKADCLNCLYQAIQDWEEDTGTRFEIVVTHDAEDLIHPESLSTIDHYSQQYDMVQIPVLPLPTPVRNLVHGLYCDEFAEYQTKDIPVRQRLGGFVPSNGVGTGFTREVLDRIAQTRGGMVFEPECLTEDYENGWAVHALGRPQLFVQPGRIAGVLTATREYFPRTIAAAIRQRTRWVTGIALQGWERHGWRGGLGPCYWFWRDRKGVVGSLIAPLANLVFLYLVTSWALRFHDGMLVHLPGWASLLCETTVLISGIQILARTICTSRFYGLGFALLSPVRVLLGNFLNCAATVLALSGFLRAKLRRTRLAWGKTDHQYPAGALLKPHTPKLGEILIQARCLSPAELERALADPQRLVRLGEYLTRTGAITERNLYQALSIQAGLPFDEPRRITRSAARLLPAATSRRWNVLPLEVSSGVIEMAAAEIPDDAMMEEIRRFSPLEVRWRLLPPAHIERLREASYE
jgi:adsorption protein B